MNIKAVLVEKVSKTGEKYICVEVYYTATYKKILFPSKAELELIKLANTSTK